jgi:acetyltransferase-like isoleucine patch superfamily enzyme
MLNSIKLLNRKIFLSGYYLSIPRTLFINLKLFKSLTIKIFIGKKTVFLLNKSSSIKIDGELFVDSKNGGQFWHYSSFRLMDKTKFHIKGKVNFYSGAQVKLFDNSRLDIDDGTYFSGPITIHCNQAIQIGKNCGFSWGCTIIDSDFHEVHRDEGIKSSPVIIGNNVWVGNGSIILKGTVIHDNAIVSAGSVVKGKLISNGIYAGNPAKLIDMRRT